MSSSYNTVPVQTSATVILAPNNGRRGFVIKNQGSNNLYIGMDANVSSSNGFLLFPQDSWDLNGSRCWRGAVYGIAVTSSNDVRYWEWTD